MCVCVCLCTKYCGVHTLTCSCRQQAHVRTHARTHVLKNEYLFMNRTVFCSVHA